MSDPDAPTAAAAVPTSAAPLPTALLAISFHLCYLILPLVAAFGPFVLIFSDYYFNVGIAWLVAYLSWFAVSYPSEVDGQGRPWIAFENFYLFQRIFAWFPLKLIATQPLPCDKQYIFGVHPHGGLAFGRALFGFCTRQLWDQAFPGIDFRVLTATAAFRVPVIREMWLWSYCIDASKPVAVRALDTKKLSLLLYPGGIKEQLMTQRGKHRIYLNNRKGFVKLALQHGCALVPIYIFGECDLYDHWSWGLETRQGICDRFGAAVMLLSGSIGLLPYRVPVTGVSGPPIAVQQVEMPTQKQIDDLHATYVRALVTLFDTHKTAHGYKDAKLEIF